MYVYACVCVCVGNIVERCFNDSPASARWHMCLSRGNVLVPEADVLRFEDFSVGHFAAGDNVQLVHGLHHSPARREREIRNNRFMTNV